MVDYGSGPIKESIDNTVFIVPGIIIGCLFGNKEIKAISYHKKQERIIKTNIMIPRKQTFTFFAYKLIKSLRDKEKMKQEKKLMKEKRKERDHSKRLKKR